uniref:Uncharacterized protein n=1 Tax=Leviviridae sp. TaxID=2027243 RepID=A0A514CYV5_9VIRU|nr:MAG: hypothetical protein H3Bulk421105_000002 [Leviviridae sp.]QDH86860.1 MAG: hypothetical protein H2Rhizo32860_000002 [Leviviridae sp.]
MPYTAIDDDYLIWEQVSGFPSSEMMRIIAFLCIPDEDTYWEAMRRLRSLRIYPLSWFDCRKICRLHLEDDTLSAWRIERFLGCANGSLTRPVWYYPD